MNQAELAALAEVDEISARLLYCGGLRPFANQLTGASMPLDYQQLCSLLTTSAKTFRLGRQVNDLLRHLAQAGLVSLPPQLDLNKSVNGSQVVLPLLINNDVSLLQQTSMHKHWQVVTNYYQDACQLVGLIDHAYTEQELGEFISYWMSRPDTQLNPLQWTQKFVQQLKRQRSQGRAERHTQTIGTQTVAQAAGVHVDDNAQALKNKYYKKS